MVAAAAFAARAAFKIRLAGDAPQLERFGNMLLDRMLNLMQLLLRVQKSPRNGIVQQGVAVFFKVGNFNAVERLRTGLFFLERLAFAHQRFILAARGGVGQKSVNALADATGLEVFQNGFAQFAGLVFNFVRHK